MQGSAFLCDLCDSALKNETPTADSRITFRLDAANVSEFWGSKVAAEFIQFGAWCGTQAFFRKALSTTSAMMVRPSRTVDSSMAKETRRHSWE
jgi:hypothetical protein